MPLVKQLVPNLVQGVSQQAAATRLDGQCEDMVNCMVDPATGLRKRPALKWAGDLPLVTANKDKSHFIKRSENENYVLSFSNDQKLHIHRCDVLDSSGLEFAKPCAIIGSDGEETTTGIDISSTGTNAAYLNCLDANDNDFKNKYKLNTVGDTTYIVNTNTLVEAKAEKSAELSDEILVFVKQGAYDTPYTVSLHSNHYTNSKTPFQINIQYEHWNNIYAVNGTFNYGGGGSRIIRVKSVSGSVGGTGYIPNKTYTFPITCVVPNGIRPFRASSSSSYRNNIQVGNRHPDAVIQVTANANGEIPTNSTFTVLEVGTLPAGMSTDPITGTDTRLVAYGGVEPVIPTPDAVTGTGFAFGITTPIDAGSGGTLNIGDGVDHNLDNLSTSSSNYICAKLFDELKSKQHTVDSNVTDFIKLYDPTNTYGYSGATDNSTDDVLLTVELKSNLIVLRKVTNKTRQVSLSVTDGLADQGLGLINKEVASISDLPVSCLNGHRVAVKGDSDEADNYYVEFVTNSGAEFGDGYWKETIGPNLSKGVENTSMPIKLVNIAENTFQIFPMSLTERACGDDNTNPLPSFVGRRIANTFFYKNRLGFLADDNVIMSEIGLGLSVDGVGFTNFHRTTVQGLLDSDPIDITVGATELTNLKSATPLQESLILFSETHQFSLETGGRVLSPTTVSCIPVTSYPSLTNIPPITIGDSLYFASNREDSTKVSNYTVNQASESYEAVDITGQVPSYVMKDATFMVGSATSDVILVGDGSETVYVYKFLKDQGRTLLSSWGKWTFPNKIANAMVDRDKVFFYTVMPTITRVSTRRGMLCTMNLNPKAQEPDERLGTFSYGGGAAPLLDLYVAIGEVGTGSNHLIDYRDYLTYLGYPSNYLSTGIGSQEYMVYGAYGAVDEDGFGAYDKDAALHTVVNVGSDYSEYGAPVWVGLPYTMEYTFSKPVIKTKSQNATVATNVPHRVKNVSVYYKDIVNKHQAAFKIRVKHKRNAKFSSPTTVYDTDWDKELSQSSGFLKGSIFLPPDETTIQLINDKAGQVFFQNAEIESLVYVRSKQI